MNDLDFLQAVKRYIEESEVSFEAEYGCLRSLDELLHEGAMPDLYFEVIRHIEGTREK